MISNVILYKNLPFIRICANTG